MKKHNVLYISSFGDLVGGGEFSFLGLVSHLDPERFTPVVVCPSEGSLVEEIGKLGIEFSIIPMPRLKWINPFSLFSSVRSLVRLIRGKGISLVHANGSRCAVYGGIACMIARVPMIWHVRILESDAMLDRVLAWMSVMVMVNSRAVKGRFSWMKRQEKVQVVYNGINLCTCHDQGGSGNLRAELGISDKTALIGIVGRLDWYKAHKYFLEAAQKIKLVLPDSHFLIVGEGENRGSLERQAEKLGIRSCVTFTGHRRDIPAILSALDVFALSSVSEGFGRVVAEAMACAKPVVATRVGGLLEVIEEGATGKLVPPANPLALAGAVLEVLRDKEKARVMGEAGRLRAQNLFGVEKNAETTEVLYERILGAE